MQYTLKSKIANEGGGHCKRERNNHMTFQFNNILQKNKYLPTHVFSGSSSSLQSISAFDSVYQKFSATFLDSYIFVASYLLS